MSLYSIHLDNNGLPAEKWSYFFPVYERYLQKFINESTVLWEIGVFRGGSLPMWKKYLGPLATIVGIDIDPRCKEHENALCNVRIGSQSDTSFLWKVIREFGHPDIVIDDGSHLQKDMEATFNFMFPRLNNNGVYIVEDTHACYWPAFGGKKGSPDSFIEKAKMLVDKMHLWWYAPQAVDDMTRNLWSVNFFDSMVVFEKKLRKEPSLLTTYGPGTNKVDYGGVGAVIRLDDLSSYEDNAGNK